MDLPQLGPVAVLLLKSRKSAACPETPSVTLATRCGLPWPPAPAWEKQHVRVCSPLIAGAAPRHGIRMT